MPWILTAILDSDCFTRFAISIGLVWLIGLAYAQAHTGNSCSRLPSCTRSWSRYRWLPCPFSSSTTPRQNSIPVQAGTRFCVRRITGVNQISNRHPRYTRIPFIFLAIVTGVCLGSDLVMVAVSACCILLLLLLLLEHFGLVRRLRHRYRRRLPDAPTSWSSIRMRYIWSPRELTTFRWRRRHKQRRSTVLDRRAHGTRPGQRRSRVAGHSGHLRGQHCPTSARRQERRQLSPSPPAPPGTTCAQSRTALPGVKKSRSRKTSRLDFRFALLHLALLHRSSFYCPWLASICWQPLLILARFCFRQASTI